MRVPAVSREIDCGGPLPIRVSIESRVSSPSAANTAARVLSAAAALGILEVLLDVLDLCGPAAVVHAIGLRAPVRGDLVEAALDDTQTRAVCRRLECELDQRLRLPRVVDVGIDRVGMPGQREQPFRLHLLDDDVPANVLVTRICDLAGRRLSRNKRSFDLHAEPLSELAIVGESFPHARHRGLQVDGLFDTVRHTQPPCCLSNTPAQTDTQPFCCALEQSNSASR